MNDYEYMNLALSLACATLGQTSPNPSVGAVLVKDGQLVGTGVHLKAGTPHAEVHAINEAGISAEGAIMYVTLEPCSHQGKTPPCTDLIIKTGIRKIFVATLDPNPLVAGKGVEKLTRAGIEVEVGLCKEEAKQLNEKFFHFIQTNTPFVTIKAGISLDGKIAAKSGDSKWITSPESRQDGHHLRHEHDGILVGINTILQDNPLLTTRRPRGGINPIRIVLDTKLKIPTSANVVQDRSARTIIFTGNQIDLEKKKELERFGVTIISQDRPILSLQQVLKTLGEQKMMSVLVEGGSEIHASFIKENAFQQIITYVAPKIIGGRDAFPFVGGVGSELVKLGKHLHFTEIKQLGPDIKITAKPLNQEETEKCLPESLKN
ncbi:bifunctional diaminohydroxyphosphoribosylaminopyrimidine deaminase/5-amino-6-(5-phosphoribosylamino)uracil reductase RibD [Caldifermentibacillus hisashii]|uniref:bifunctional diaminohydroxyphosphoribosylaminopyrimidine deaminase/5-amino-6-(5-phosphoribosylamino)uracil reductase RibD n=1 Tax=Bacillaceae TaxID=186817 RepID=UPI0005A421C9|nr:MULTISPECIES: bifunctional diaminohydroxyphosphoribosylaminopyrimidine deaminase/5-amino-6-(5-phosphoribosylamino)uracil reductase RibD [Bacillaceae]MCB5933352.1 bifunctional diaminohydroxyphosphoribosylaminopyrimidine deaminase/5-amino-6-(5-phosphoribosylamino)uracil reductase RibD [Bacillus sp. DFI.2.34]KIO65502.1 Diaminohydroxyphosphoribosylaminopyrimidine deaminase [Caldibacillus thermoamylovorans]KIO69482.1 Diaminohydroxyphosphoribosylaminopyrimidine deaminase [Caldibacillus thermoamylov